MNPNEPQVGAPILYFPAGARTPFAGQIASVQDDKRVNIAYFDGSGQSQSKQSVPITQEAAAGGDYVVLAAHEQTARAIAAHQKAMEKGHYGQPDQDASNETPAQRKKRAADEKKAQQTGDFSSAAAASDNVQPAGSGGPFDPANTSKAHLTQHQVAENQSPGWPTTGGVTPKLSEANMGQLSERDRETAQRIEDAKSPREKALAAQASVSGMATPGTSKKIVDAEKARAKGPDPKEVKKRADAAALLATPMPEGQPAVNEEQRRLARDKARSEEAQRISKERFANEKKAAKKPAARPIIHEPFRGAKKVPAKAAKKAPAKKAAKKGR